MSPFMWLCCPTDHFYKAGPKIGHLDRATVQEGGDPHSSPAGPAPTCPYIEPWTPPVLDPISFAGRSVQPNCLKNFHKGFDNCITKYLFKYSFIQSKLALNLHVIGIDFL